MARALAHSRLVDEAFRQAVEVRELEMMSRETATHDAREDQVFAAGELQAEAEREQMAEQARQTVELGARSGAHPSGGVAPADSGGQGGEALACPCWRPHAWFPLFRRGGEQRRRWP